MIREIFLFQWRGMGMAAYLPPIALLVIFLYLAVDPPSAGIFLSDQQLAMGQALEILVPVWGGWWSVFLVSEAVKEEGEVLFSYPTSPWSWGMGMVLLYWLLFFSLVTCGLATLTRFTVVIPVSVWIQLGVQSLFYAGLGYASVTLMGRVHGAIAAVLIYGSTQVVTMGNLFPWINIYWYLYHPTSLLEGSELIIRAGSVGGAACLLLLFGQRALFRFRRF